MSLNKVNKQTGETSMVAGLGGSSRGGHTIQNESGADLTQRDTMQFTGQAKATDDSTNGKTIIDVSPEVIDWDDWRQMTDQEKEAIPEAMIENAPGVDGLLSATLLTKLWENPSPTSAFAAQNASLASNDYDILACIYAYQKDNLLRCNSILLEKGNNAVLESSNVSGDSNYIFINNRKLYAVSDGTYKNISFGSNIYRRVDQTSSQGTVDNNVNIPIAIYGIKKTINLEFSAIASDVSTSADKCMLSDNVTSVGDIIDKGSVSVTANGVKTYSQLFNDLFALIDMSKVSVDSKLVWITSSSTLAFIVRDFNSSQIRMNLSYVDTNTVSLDTIIISASSVWNRCNLTTSISYLNRSNMVPTNGDLLTFYY